ncbi:hypothetical protein RDI58_009423 [Solanum bulbocastanum]|uniref:Uncharacterized protein n=1 Tax=Solanum bulbocastanum TaxID=147425 RepID=A0AAN8U3U8_SOLBU
MELEKAGCDRTSRRRGASGSGSAAVQNCLCRNILGYFSDERASENKGGGDSCCRGRGREEGVTTRFLEP